jgi:hypothetical protein
MAKYSGGPKCRAKSASQEAARAMPTTPIDPAMNEPTAATGGAAGAALLGHLVAVRAVTTDAASPGTLTRMDVVEPPYIDP